MKSMRTGTMSITKSTIITILLLAAPTLALATPITGSATGTLTLGTLTASQLSWGTPASTLAAGINAAGIDPIAKNYATDGGANIRLASLTWTNRDDQKTTISDITWGVTINLTDPAHTETMPSNKLNIKLNKSQGEDQIQLQSLDDVSWAFMGWEATNFRYFVDDSSTALNTKSWKTKMGDTSTLWMVADFMEKPVQIFSVDSPAVPEPSTLCLLLGGIAGLTLIRRKTAR